jgi:RimJ/RimL family protein N-acetyltransferase
MDTRLRKAAEQDTDVTYAWVNHPSVRKYSLNKDWVSFEGHRDWFHQKIKDNNTLYYILTDAQDTPLGSVRFDLFGDEAKINYLIAPLFQGQGLGRKILEHGIARVEIERTDVKTVFGWVFKDNEPSIRIFNRLGFELIEEIDGLMKFAKELSHADRSL